MALQKLALAACISSTLILSGCYESDSADQAYHGSSGTGSETTLNQDDPSPEMNDDQEQSLDSSTQPLAPAVATLDIPHAEYELSGGQTLVPVAWYKYTGTNAAYWQVVINGELMTPLFAVEQSNGTQQSASYEFRLTRPGEYQVQARLCDQSRLRCTVSTGKTISVAEDPAQYVSDQGTALRSGYNEQLCLVADRSHAWAESCNDSMQQSWVIEGDEIRSALDTRLCLTASSFDNESKVHLDACGQGEFQDWQYGQTAIRNGNWALDLDRRTQDVIVYGFHGNDNQRWLDDAYVPEGAQMGIHQDDNGWAQVNVHATGPYSSANFMLPAAQNWVNTGLYLRRGQTVTILADGAWNVKDGGLYGPEGDASRKLRGCNQGQLVARIGLYYEDADLACIGRSGTLVAQKDGIVFVGGIVSTDLGETYETRKNARGSLNVTVMSEGDTVPTVPKDMATYYDYQQVSSGWVELRSPYNILTLPTATAMKDKAKLRDALQRLDDIYLAQKDLRGAVPQHGQPIRWFPDTENAPGWMLAGNPVRMDPALVNANSKDRITLVAEPGNGAWGFAHELGHDFNFVNGDWYYTSSTAGLETWPNVFTVYAQETLELPKRQLDCEAKSLAYKSLGSYQTDFKGDVWLSLCFLLEFKDVYGWDFYKRFYAEFNRSPVAGWSAIKTRFSAAAGEDVTPLFNEWRIPI